jgi:hypothetical protein
VRTPGRFHIRTEGCLKKGAQRRERVLAHRHTRGHGVTAALGE